MMSAAEHVERIEVQWQFFPELVSRQREHRVWLTLNEGADCALYYGARIGVGGPHFHFRRRRESSIHLQADRYRNREPLADGAWGRTPAGLEMPKEGTNLALRQLIRGTLRCSEPDRAVDHIAGRRYALRSAFIEQRLDLARIKLRLLLLWRRLGLRLGLDLLFRLGLSFFRLGLLLCLLRLGLRQILLDRLCDQVALWLRVLLLGRWRLRLRHGCISRRMYLGLGDLGGRIGSRIALAELIDNRRRSLGGARARGELRELAHGYDIDRHRLRDARQRPRRKGQRAPAQHNDMHRDRHPEGPGVAPASRCSADRYGAACAHCSPESPYLPCSTSVTSATRWNPALDSRPMTLMTVP